MSNTYEYELPSFITEKGEIAANVIRGYDDKLLEKLKTNLEYSMNHLRANRAWQYADACKAILYGDEDVKVLDGMSKLTLKKLRRQGREAIATQTNIQPKIKFRASKVEEYQSKAESIEKLFQTWWIEANVDEYIKAVGQEAGGAGTGTIFLWPKYDEVTDEIEISIDILDYQHFLPLHVPKSGDVIKGTYLVNIHLEKPLPELHAEFPLHCDIIREDRNVPSWLSKGVITAKRVWRGMVDRVRRNKERINKTFRSSFPTGDLFYTFVRDSTFNDTGRDIIMGLDVPNFPHYIVPSLHDKDGNINTIGTGIYDEVPEINDVTQERSYKRVERRRNVTVKDCKLFPNGRQIIWTNYGIIYDGPKRWGDGRFPAIPFRLEKLEGEFLGIPILIDGRSLEASANNILRSMENSIIGKMKVPIGVHDRANPKLVQILEKYGIFGLLGRVFKTDLNIIREPIKTLMDKEFFDIDRAAPEFLKFLLEMQDYEIGTTDFSNAWKLKQIPAMDTQEYMKMLSGALAVDQSREIGRSLFKVAEVWFSYVPQVYTTQKRLVKQGVNGVELDDIDYKPDSFLPKKDVNDTTPEWKRIRQFLKNFNVYAVSDSLQEQQSQTRRLTLLQIQAKGAKISGEKIYKEFTNEDDYLEQEEKFYKEQERAAIAAANIEAQVQKIMNAGSGRSKFLKEVGDALRSGDYGILKEIMGGTYTGRNEGRPNTFEEPAKLDTSKTDDDGVPRTTITSS